jgi:GT2 family glycosyltransferase
MDLSIIIVNWNSVAYLKACLASVFKQTENMNCEIIVIDAASFDGCEAMLGECFPRVHFIQSLHNVGFGRTNNQAFKRARGDSVLFLNPDTEIVGAAISSLYEGLQRLPNAGAVGCRLLNSDGSLQTSCIQSFPSILNQILDTEWLRQKWPAAWLWGTTALYASDNEPQVVDAIAGACVMMKRAVFEHVGGFSDEYFMYAEDIDLCHKTQVLGLTNYYLPTATVIHHGGASSQKAASNFSVVLMRESICHYLSKTRGRLYGAAYRLAMLGVACVRLTILRLSVAGCTHHAKNLPTSDSLRKWRAVLRWSLFRQSTVKQFEPMT